jgi:putative transposase
MVRARVVKHPCEWAYGGDSEIQELPSRYAVIDLRQLSSLCGFAEVTNFQQAHGRWIGEALRRPPKVASP